MLESKPPGIRQGKNAPGDPGGFFLLKNFKNNHSFFILVPG